jgi:glycosyltransferase involved in cell wall biosynthesis
MTDDPPQISVVIPAWNEENYIGRCLDSILKQDTLVSYEVIVVNNNSVDQTVNITKSKKGAILLNESRQGVAFARNTGAKAARGAIIAFVDADCIPPFDHLKKIFTFFQSNEKEVGLVGPYVYYDGNFLAKFATYNLNYYSLYYRIKKITDGFQEFSGGDFVIRKQVFESVGGFNEKITDIIYPEDLELAKRIFKAGYKLYFDKNFKMPTSFRRVKRSPFRDAYKRFMYAREVVAKDK